MKIVFEQQDIFVGTGDTQWNENFPTLYLQHGAGLDRTVWVLLGRYFARHGYNVVAPDLPGHGSSSGEPIDSIEACASWVNRLLAHLHKEHGLAADNLIYCGHSMGSLVALEAAAGNVANVQKLILLGSAVPMGVGEALLSAARNNEHAAIEMINMYGHGFGSRIGNNPISGINIYNTMEVLLERADDGVLFTDLNACNEYTNGQTAAQTLAGNVQATVISGDSDFMTPTKLGMQIAEQLQATFTLLDDCGHMMMSEKPEATLQAMKRALV